jgi:hypothetical protein
VIVLGVLAVLLIAVIAVVVGVGFTLNQRNTASQNATATALAQVVPVQSPTATLVPATSTPSSFTGMVKAETAILRSSPSQSGSEIGLVQRGARLTVRARSADDAWLRVEAADGTPGWIPVNAIELGNVSLAQIPQAVVLSVPTATPNLVVTAAACKPAAQVTDVNVPDGSQFKPGEAFVKIWRFLNSGNCTWEKGSKILFQSGDKIGSDSFPLDGTEVGASTEITMSMTAPQTPGTYKATWAFLRPSGETITTFDVSILVPTPTPTRVPTSTRGPTSTPRPTIPPVAAATATPGQASGAIGPVGNGEFRASWNGSIWSCVYILKSDTDPPHWEWEADFPIEVYGGNAGYTIKSTACRWSSGSQVFLCHWGAREEGTVTQSVEVSCPGCKQQVVSVSASTSRKGTTCVQK